MQVFELPRTSIYTERDFKGTWWPQHPEITSGKLTTKTFWFWFSPFLNQNSGRVRTVRGR